jgi:DNA (cytosine-5)-methyltransferase 1
MPHWQWPWHAEIEKFPSTVMAARHPDSNNLGDVSADDFVERAQSIARPDVLVFGSPCQSYSIAGRRLGLDDPRGNLALIALGIIDRLEPRWFVFENVPGLLSSSEGQDFGIFLRTVDELGYFGAWASLDAQHFGVAQRHERLFFVGHSGDWRCPAAVLFESEGLCGYHPPRRQAGERPAPTIASRPTGGGGLGTDFDCDGGLIAGSLGTRSAAHPSGMKHEADFMVATRDVSHCLNAGGMNRIDYETETLVTHALRADGFDASEDGTGRGTPLVTHALDSFSAGRMTEDGTGRGCPIIPVAFAHQQDGNMDLHIGQDVALALQRSQGQAIAFSCKDHGTDAAELAPTLRAMGHDGSHANAGGQVAIAVALRGREGGAAAELSDVPSALRSSQGGGDKAHVLTSMVRRLTPRECERLQGFPDDYTLITYRGKPAADGPRYKALGNSMAVPVMRWILSRIERVHQLSSAQQREGNG